MWLPHSTQFQMLHFHLAAETHTSQPQFHVHIWLASFGLRSSLVQSTMMRGVGAHSTNMMARPTSWGNSQKRGDNWEFGQTYSVLISPEMCYIICFVPSRSFQFILYIHLPLGKCSHCNSLRLPTNNHPDSYGGRHAMPVPMDLYILTSSSLSSQIMDMSWKMLWPLCIWVSLLNCWSSSDNNKGATTLWISGVLSSPPTHQERGTVISGRSEYSYSWSTEETKYSHSSWSPLNLFLNTYPPFSPEIPFSLI